MEILVDGYIQVIQEWGGRSVHRPGIEGQGELAVYSNSGRCRAVPFWDIWNLP